MSDDTPVLENSQVAVDNHILSDEHLKQLHGSAISDEVIKARGYRTITKGSELENMDSPHPSGELLAYFCPCTQQMTDWLLCLSS